jgi:hypothetical protein
VAARSQLDAGCRAAVERDACIRHMAEPGGAYAAITFPHQDTSRGRKYYPLSVLAKGRRLPQFTVSMPLRNGYTNWVQFMHIIECSG